MLHVNSFLIANMPDLIHIEEKKVDLKQEWFIEMVKKWKSLLKDPMFIVPFTETNSYLNWLKGGLIRQGATSGVTLQDQMGWYCKFNEVGSIDSIYVPMFSGEKNRNHIAYSSDLYSICNTSENKEEAWEFLSYLLTAKAQSFLSYTKNYTNLVAREERFASLAEYQFPEYEDKVEQFSASFRELQKDIDYLYDMDYYVTDLLKPLNDYFNDKLTLDEAIEQAEQSIWIRMNE